MAKIQKLKTRIANIIRARVTALQPLHIECLCELDIKRNDLNYDKLFSYLIEQNNYRGLHCSTVFRKIGTSAN